MADLNDTIDQLATESAAADATPEKKAPEKVSVNLGNRTFEFDNPQLAREVQSAFDSLHGSYGAQLDEFRRQALQTIGAPPQQAPPAAPAPLKLNVPASDLMFVDGGKPWAEGFSRELGTHLNGVREYVDARTEAAVQVALEQAQQQMQAREVAWWEQQCIRDAFNKHPELYETVKLPNGATVSGTRLFQMLRNEMVPQMPASLPIGEGMDRIGEAAAQEMRTAKALATVTAPGGRGQVAAPRLLSSAQRSGASADTTPTTTRTLSDMIETRQQENLRRARGRAA